LFFFLFFFHLLFSFLKLASSGIFHNVLLLQSNSVVFYRAEVLLLDSFQPVLLLVVPSFFLDPLDLVFLKLSQPFLLLPVGGFLLLPGLLFLDVPEPGLILDPEPFSFDVGLATEDSPK
jgi:hypothetical protein